MNGNRPLPYNWGMSTTTQRTVQDRAAGIERQIRALARNPEEWDATDLRLLGWLENEIAAVRSRVVNGLRDHGVNDQQIGEALGITRQAVSKRWPGGGRYVGAAGRYRKSPDIDPRVDGGSY